MTMYLCSKPVAQTLYYEELLRVLPVDKTTALCFVCCTYISCALRVTGKNICEQLAFSVWKSRQPHQNPHRSVHCVTEVSVD